MPPIIAVFGSSKSQPTDPEYIDGVRLGQLLASSGFTVANGGYSGLMEAVAAGARTEGGEVIGITAPNVFPGRLGVNPHITSELTSITISERIHRLVDLANASIALPGSLGTLAELVVAWNDGFVAPFSGKKPKPVITVGRAWREIVDDLVSLISADRRFVVCVDSVEDAVAELFRHFDKPGIAGPSV